MAGCTFLNERSWRVHLHVIGEFHDKKWNAVCVPECLFLYLMCIRTTGCSEYFYGLLFFHTVVSSENKLGVRNVHKILNFNGILHSSDSMLHVLVFQMEQIYYFNSLRNRLFSECVRYSQWFVLSERMFIFFKDQAAVTLKLGILPK